MTTAVAVVVVRGVTPAIPFLVLHTSPIRVIPPISRTVPSARTPLHPLVTPLTELCSQSLLLSFNRNRNVRVDNVRGRTKNGTNSVERWFGWLSEKRCANAAERLVKIHENDIFQSIVIDFDAYRFEL
jgi:hypothetical protein